METYGKILLIAMPIFLILVLLEKWYAFKNNKNELTNNNLDTISSLLSGVTNVTKDVLQIGITILGYGWLVKHVAVYKVENVLLTYIIAFFALDFMGYWVHRIQHRVNFFWNYHLIHHSSEHFDLACALRQSISALINVFSFFLLPAALLGVPEQVIAVVAPLHLFAQFWYHTVHINKMGFLEKIIVTPSHHRVHHAINAEYIDKNYAQIFIFWDKWFGTFQNELSHIPPKYGITVPVKTWNPIKINFQHWLQMFKDSWHTKKLIDKVKIWIMPTGWRPIDVAEKYPLQKIENVYQFEKYNTYASPFMQKYYWFQLLALLLYLSYFFANIATFSISQMFVYGAYIYVYIYALTDLMDTNKSSTISNGILTIFGISILIYQNNWFGLIEKMPIMLLFIFAHQIAMLIISIYFNKTQQHLKTATATI
jgi:alkylglycerol monooxygenase